MATDLKQVKLKLAEKYERLARLTKSTPKRRTFQNRADRFRRQVTELERNA